MTDFDILGAASSGMQAQRAAMDIQARNVAHAQTGDARHPAYLAQGLGGPQRLELRPSALREPHDPRLPLPVTFATPCYEVAHFALCCRF
jgi:hypothetical protein